MMQGPSKIVFILIGLISVAGFLVCVYLVRNRGAIFMESDALAYYLYARSIVHDGDIDFSNELQFFKKNGTRLVGGVGVFNPDTHRYTNQYTIGFPLLVLPFYGPLSTIASQWYHEKSQWLLDQAIFCLGSIMLGILGMLLSYKFASRYFSPKISLLATVIFWASSPVIYYLIFEPYVSHLVSIFAVSAFLCLWKSESISTNIRVVLMGLLAGVIAMIRQQEILIVVIPILFAVLSPNFSLRQTPLFRVTLLFVASFLLAFSIQMIVWKILTGYFVVYSYSESGQFLDFASPKFLDVLFSSNHGLLIWHPIIVISLFGLLISRTLSLSAKISFLFAFLCQLYITSSWSMWWMGYSFGNRAFLGLTPIFIVGLASFLQESLKIFRARTLLPIFILLSIWNGVLMMGYVSDMIPHQGEFSWMGFIKRIPELPGRITEKIEKLKSADFTPH